MYFDEAVQAGSGDIVISSGSDTRMISINDASQVTFDGYGGVIINPTIDLTPNMSYNIQLAEGVIMDMEGNAYAGINDATTLNFMTTDFVTDPFVTTMGGYFVCCITVL